MKHICNGCDEHPPVWAWETAGRGWKFLCEGCYEWSTPILQMYCEPFDAARYYPTYNYDTRTVS